MVKKLLYKNKFSRDFFFINYKQCNRNILFHSGLIIKLFIFTLYFQGCEVAYSSMYMFLYIGCIVTCLCHTLYKIKITKITYFFEHNIFLKQVFQNFNIFYSGNNNKKNKLRDYVDE